MKAAYDLALESMRGNPEALLPKRSGDGWTYLCPAHPAADFAGFIQDNPKSDDGAPILKCENGCTKKDIERVLRVKGLWLWDKRKKDKTDDSELERRIGAWWVYTSRDADQTPCLRVSHWNYFTPDGEFVKSETVRQKPDGKGNWISASADYSVPPLNWQAVREKAFYGKTVFCVDGESSMDELTRLGFTGFTTDGGAGNIAGFENSGVGQDCKTTDGCVESVVIIPIMSEAGMRSARAKARFLHVRQIPVKLLVLPGLAPISSGKGECLLQWVERFHTNIELAKLANDCPLWPTDPEDLHGEYIPDREPTKAEIKPVAKFAEKDEDDPLRYAFTELGNALWFKKVFKDVVAFLPRTVQSVWIIAKDGIWHFDTAKTVKNLMAQAVDVMTAEMQASGQFNTEKIMAWRSKSVSSRMISAALSLAEARMNVDIAAFNMHTWLLPCLNGVINLKTGELLPHSAEYKWTKCIDLVYNPDIGLADAPNFCAFMRDIFPDENLKEQQKKIDAVIRCFAVSLTGDPKFRKWFLLWGPKGREGKSTLAELILSLFGTRVFGVTAKKYLITDIQQDSKFSDPGSLREYRFVLMDEIGKRDKIDNEKMKSISGNDSITGSALYKDTFTFKPTHHLYVYGNSKPRFDAGGDTAAQDRCVVIPFLRHFEEHEQDDTLAERLQSEKQQLLTIMVFACVWIWNQKSLGLHEFMADARNEYLAEEDFFGQFLEQCVGPGLAPISAEDLHDCLVWWCKSEQGVMKPWPKNAMGREMNRRGYKSAKDEDSYMTYENLQIKPACVKRMGTFKNRQHIREFNN